MGRPLVRLGHTRCTDGGVHVPSRMEGLSVFGQYIRNIRMKLPFGAGSQFASLSAPGDVAWNSSVMEPSGLVVGLLRMLTVNLLSGFGTNHHPLSISYMVIDQKPLTGGSASFAKVIWYLLAPDSVRPSLSTSV